MRALFDPFKKRRIDGMLGPFVFLFARQQFEPGVIDAFPHFNRQGTAHRSCVFAARLDAVEDRRGMVGVPSQKLRHLVGAQGTTSGFKSRQGVGDHQGLFDGFRIGAADV